MTLKALSNRAGVGIRFLSEFERGKETVELGKALKALAGVGLALATSESETGPVPAAASRGSLVPAEIGLRPPGGGNAARLWDMRAAGSEIRQILSAQQEFAGVLPQVPLRRALERCFDVLGEAARRVTPDCQARHPRIPWRKLILRRNALVLDYHRDQHGELLETARADLPVLESELLRAFAAETQ